MRGRGGARSPRTSPPLRRVGAPGRRGECPRGSEPPWRRRGGSPCARGAAGPRPLGTGALRKGRVGKNAVTQRGARGRPLSGSREGQPGALCWKRRRHRWLPGDPGPDGSRRATRYPPGWGPGDPGVTGCCAAALYLPAPPVRPASLRRVPGETDPAAPAHWDSPLPPLRLHPGPCRWERGGSVEPGQHIGQNLPFVFNFPSSN